MVKLTPLMHEALTAASGQELRRVHDGKPGKPAWPSTPSGVAHASTLAALVRHGLLVRSERKSRQQYRLEVWTITDAGVAALTAPAFVFVDRPRFLNDRRYAGGDYTSRPSRSIDYDPVSRQHLECVDAPAHVVRASRVRHLDAARTERANALAARARAA